MIKFFRRIRQRLVSENRFYKYLLYAIGEIILVVIGILIALSINNWNEAQKNSKEQYFQLTKLKNNLTTDALLLKSSIDKDSIINERLKFCIEALYENSDISMIEFINAFQYITQTNSFEQSNSAFESLVSSGSIKLIKNQYIIDALFNYYNANDFLIWNESIKDYTRNIIAPYIMAFDHVPNQNESEEEIGVDLFQVDISKFKIASKTMEDYKNDVFIINCLRTKLQLMEGHKKVYSDILAEAKSLIKIIDTELQSK
jgi:hypothetical protein